MRELFTLPFALCLLTLGGATSAIAADSSRSQPGRSVVGGEERGLVPALRLALLQDDEIDDLDDLDATPEAAAQDPEVKVGGEVVDTAAAVGGATGFVFPTGFYLSADLGGFLRFGGYGDSRQGGGCFRCLPKLYSSLQPWIGVNVGYDVLPWLGFEATIGTGFISDSAPAGYSIISGEVAPPGIGDSPESSAITMVNVAVTGSWYFLDRLALQGKLFVGGAMLSPDPDPSKLNLVRSLSCDGGSWGADSPSRECGGEFGSDFGVSFGAGLGLRYATLLTNVVIGFDFNFYGVFSPNVATAHLGAPNIGSAANPNYLWSPVGFRPGLPIIPAISFAPVIKYVF
jgi:hypothetical protein